MNPRITLKKGKEKSLITNRHPWIFSGAVQDVSDDFLPGDVAEVYSFKGEFLALAYFNLDNSLAGRVLSFEQGTIETLLSNAMDKALILRKSLINHAATNCYRWINAEEDGLPGLIVDVYGATCVIQVNTLGMEKLKQTIIDLLVSKGSFESVYEKSTSSARELEGLFREEGLRWGNAVEQVLVKEEGIEFWVSVTEGQKTGCFLDQRSMRKLVGSLSPNRRVLNTFSYAGGFSLHALHGGANHVTSVDVCPRATKLCEKNLKGYEDKHSLIQSDVFDFLDQSFSEAYDFIILDPPAFAKKRKDIPKAAAGYRRLNRRALEMCPSGSLLLTCSCSYYMDISHFRQILFQAASESKREVKILSSHIQAYDHPVSLYHPEGDYLKSFLLWVE